MTATMRRDAPHRGARKPGRMRRLEPWDATLDDTTGPGPTALFAYLLVALSFWLLVAWTLISLVSSAIVRKV